MPTNSHRHTYTHSVQAQPLDGVWLVEHVMLSV